MKKRHALNAQNRKNNKRNRIKLVSIDKGLYEYAKKRAMEMR